MCFAARQTVSNVFLSPRRSRPFLAFHSQSFSVESFAQRSERKANDQHVFGNAEEFANYSGAVLARNMLQHVDRYGHVERSVSEGQLHGRCSNGKNRRPKLHEIGLRESKIRGHSGTPEEICETKAPAPDVQD